MMGLLRSLKPQWWFSAHLHCRFEAVVEHPPEQRGNADISQPSATNPDEIAIDDIDVELDTKSNGGDAPPAEAASAPAPANPDEIRIDEEEEDVAAPPPPPPPRRQTRFLALDKCLPQRKFLEVSCLDIVHQLCLTTIWRARS